MAYGTPMAGTWRVATFNIWNRQGPWAQRFPLIRDGLRALDADVIGLQEVLGFTGMPSQAHEIADGMGWHVFHAPAWDLGGGLTLGNAILSPHRLLETAALALPSPRDGRNVAFARVDTPHGLLPVFVTHLSHEAHLGHVRCQQVRALADHVAALAPIDELPPVIAGDLNADPDSDEMRFLRGLTPLGGTSVYFADCWLLTAGLEGGPGYTYDRRNVYALRSREPSRRIDYILVRGPDRYDRGEPIAARVALDQPVDGVWPSDHFAVVAEIWATPRPHDPY
jgi:endonuclease/exonuclease/phosphatase family metal-dependent hydrolase